jgi:hypothetical protein
MSNFSTGGNFLNEQKIKHKSNKNMLYINGSRKKLKKYLNINEYRI